MTNKKRIFTCVSNLNGQVTFACRAADIADAIQQKAERFGWVSEPINYMMAATDTWQAGETRCRWHELNPEAPIEDWAFRWGFDQNIDTLDREEFEAYCEAWHDTVPQTYVDHVVGELEAAKDEVTP